MKQPLYRAIAYAVLAQQNCQESGNREWETKWERRLGELANMLPSGSGVDTGTCISWTTENKIVLTFSFHHMNEQGYYDGWTDHKITVTPSLLWDFDLRITGRNRNDIKEYLHDLYNTALRQEVE